VSAVFALGLCLGAWVTAAALTIYTGLVQAARADARQEASEQAQ
jgi:hypothetical protein